jgi:uncharacterized membrane protein
MFIADYDPGTVTAFYVLGLTLVLVVLTLVAWGILSASSGLRKSWGLLRSAAVFFFVGLGLAIVLLWLNSKGVLHLL